MENFDATGMQIVTSYAPARIVLLAAMRTIFGLLIGLMGALAIWATWGGDMKPTQPGDMPVWWMYLVGAALAFTGFCFVSGGLGRIVSALARNCYFKAGPDGIAISLPQQGWFGRYRLVEYNLRWNEIKQLVHFTHRINLIPVSTELRIELQAGGRVTVERHFFSASVKEIQQKLSTIEAAVGR
ncbi:MAG: hypothetical protein ABSC62_09020 [Terracidiphilus sp.]